MRACDGGADGTEATFRAFQAAVKATKYRVHPFNTSPVLARLYEAYRRSAVTPESQKGIGKLCMEEQRKIDCSLFTKTFGIIDAALAEVRGFLV